MAPGTDGSSCPQARSPQMAFLSWFGILSNSRTIGKEAEDKKSGTEEKNNFGKVKKYEKRGENKENEE